MAGLPPCDRQPCLQSPARTTRSEPLSSTNRISREHSQYHKELTVRHPKIIIASISLAAAAAIGGGITAATATTSHASSPPAASQQAAATVRTVRAAVAGMTETVLVTGQGLQGFFVATPGLTALTGSPAPAAPAPPSGNPYGY